MDLEHWNPIRIRNAGHIATLWWAVLGLVLALGAFFTFTGSDADRALMQAGVFFIFTVWMIIERNRDDHHAASTAGAIALGLRFIAIAVAGGLALIHFQMARSNGFAEGVLSGGKSVIGLIFTVWEVGIVAFMGWEIFQIHGDRFKDYVAAVQQASQQQRRN